MESKEMKELFDKLFPVGSIYAFINSVSIEDGIKRLNNISGEWEYLGADLLCNYFVRVK